MNQGRQVSVYTTQLSDRGVWNNDLPGQDHIDGVPVRRFPALKRGRVTWRIFHWCRKHYPANPNIWLEAGLMLAEGPISLQLPGALLAGQRGYGLVNLFGLYSAFVWEAFIVGRMVHLPIVVTPFIHTTPPIGLDMIWKRRVLKQADHIVAMTKSEKSYLERELELDPANISVVSPALKSSDYPLLGQESTRTNFNLPSDAFVVLFIGRKEPHKGILTLMEAFRALQGRTRRPCRLLLIGPEIAHSNLPSLEPWLDDTVIDLGEVDHNTKVNALNACSCLAFPSTSESFGIVILEAWASAKPVVASRLGPTEDTVTDGQEGYLTDAGSVEHLAEALHKLAEDNAAAAAMGAAGLRKFLASYTTETMGDTIRFVYDKIQPTGRHAHSIRH